MPNGVVRWVDAEREIGRISSWGKEYAFRAHEAERDAFTPKARVHFDIHREGGVPWAVNVRLRRGTRMSRRQHRFDEQAGVHTRAHTAERDPAELVRLWLSEVERGDAPAARDLYAPEAVVHTTDASFEGRDQILRYLADTPVVGTEPGDIVVRGPESGITTLEWLDARLGSRRETRMRVVRGEIVEQWI